MANEVDRIYWQHMLTKYATNAGPDRFHYGLLSEVIENQAEKQGQSVVSVFREFIQAGGRIMRPKEIYAVAEKMFYLANETAVLLFLLKVYEVAPEDATEFLLRFYRDYMNRNVGHELGCIAEVEILLGLPVGTLVTKEMKSREWMAIEGRKVTRYD